jgi:hypothetical protein
MPAADAPISNRWLATASEALFTHTSSYQSQVPMAGRQREFSEIAELLTGRGRRVVIVSANLGAGKTFLVQRVFGELTKDDSTPFDESEHTVSVQANSMAEGPYGFTSADGNVLLIEELDRKLSWAQLTSALMAGVRWLEEQRHGAVLLTGDRFLEHPFVAELLDRLDAERTSVALDDLDRPLLVDAIRLRIEQQLQYLGEQPLAAAAEAAERLLSDRWIAAGLLPPTSGQSVATFRDALAALDGLRSKLELTPEPCRLSAQALSGYRDSGLPSRGLRRELEQALSREILAREGAGERMAPLGVEELIALVEQPVGDDDDYDPEVYLEEVVEPLAQSGVLLPLGIPYERGEQYRNRIAGPFLPTTRAFLRAFSTAVERPAAAGGAG